MEFVDKFKGIDLLNFFDFTIFEEGDGFSVYKKFEDDKSDKLSLLKFSVSNIKDEKGRNVIEAVARYGKKIEQGLQFTENKISEPLNIESSDEYFFDIDRSEIYKKDEKLTPLELINDFYQQHIKTTKIIEGFWLRIKIVCFREIFKNFFICLQNLFYHLLHLLNGDEYSYNPLGEREILNGRTISSKFDKLLGIEDSPKINKNIQRKKEIDFFGYKTSVQVIVFYSVTHLLAYIVCIILNYSCFVIVDGLGNNFLMLLYVFLSLWFFEDILPIIFKKLIKFNSKMSFNCFMKTIKV